ncbi:Oligopeptide transporter 2 [Psilocybe cubensis]|uniref:Oligopeptide transporter 2 n=1 Tax=Psilocybe cubensis TaxID=181762 RepID=A0ACB8GLV7_PSICU|nr:Oligopeptide transporter 2 [Psilocybe cubensis]KAH9476518.1 Oligopeptide transporter 2 [Psilocybe cubensis]
MEKVATAVPAANVDPESRSSYSNEKFDEKDEKRSVQEVTKDFEGEVYDDLRAVDLDENGKERPIETDMDVATRLISLDDDPTLPAFTFRMWFLGIGLSCFGAVLGQIFYFRPQTVFVSQLFIQIIAYILGRVLEEIIPGPGNERKNLQTKDNAFWRFMNPGPFNIKEHVAITIFASTAADSALAISIFAADDLYYDIKPNAGIGIFTLIGSQLMGYGLGGVMRSFLVYPTYIVFPNLLPTVQLFDALHRGKKIFMQKKRVKFFWSVFIGIFVWEWFPEYIAPTLTGISIFCLANKNSPWFTRIFGGSNGNEGLGMFALCLDWNYVGSGGGSMGALFTPLSTQLSLYCGTAICIIAFCVGYHNNVWNGQNFPFLSQQLFNLNGTRFNQRAILDENFMLDREKLAEVGLPWFASSQVISKIGFNLAIGATVTHVFIWYGKDIVEVIRKYRAGENYDPHLAKMKAYPEVPMWWYIAMFIASFAMAMSTMYAGHSGMPWWGLIVGVIISTIFLPFVITVYAITGFSPNIQHLVQMLGAAMMPGNPQANMYFTLYGYNTLDQARGLIRDLKMGQYTKLPPRVTFTVQSLGSIIGGLLNYVIMKTIIKSRREILLQVQGTNVWSGQQVQSFNSNAISWGALGSILYAPGGRYAIVPFSILIGLAVPIPFWLLHKRFPKLGANKVVSPILCWTLGYLNVGINSSVFTTFMLAVFSQYYLRRYRPRWFRKYNFLMSAALDGGTQVMVFVFTFAVGGGSGKVVDMPHWALGLENSSRSENAPISWHLSAEMQYNVSHDARVVPAFDGHPPPPLRLDISTTGAITIDLRYRKKI